MLTISPLVWLRLLVVFALLLPVSLVLAGQTYLVSFHSLDFYEEKEFRVHMFDIHFSCAWVIAFPKLPHDWSFEADNLPGSGATISGGAYHGSSMIGNHRLKELFFKNIAIIEAEDEGKCPVTVFGEISTIDYYGGGEEDVYYAVYVTTKNLSLIPIPSPRP